MQVRIVPTESIQSSFMLREQEWGVLSITKTILRRTKEQFNLKYQNQSREQTLVEVNIHHRNFTTDHRCKHMLIHTLNIHRWNYYPISP